MENPAALSLKKFLDLKKISAPSLHIVLGSGLGTSLAELKIPEWKFVGEITFKDIEGVNPSTAPGHFGAFRFYANKKNVISFQTGRLHNYEGNSPKDVVAPVLAVADLGVKKFILTNAAGSCQLKHKAGTVMLIADQVNLTGLNPLTGPNDESVGPRFSDMSQTYSPQINALLKKKLKAQKVSVSAGIYMGLNGPCFETPAETHLYQKWGIGAVGMSTVFEAIALKHRGAQLGGLSFIANMGTGIGNKRGKTLSGEEVLEEGKKKAPRILRALFDAALELLEK